MKNIRFLVFILAISTLVMSACGAATATPTVASVKVEAMPVAFIGIVNSIAGDQWVISNTTVTVDPAVVRDGPFAVGDQVKVEGVVNPDGSFTVSRVEVPITDDLSGLPAFGNANSNDANTNDANVNDGNINDANANDVNSNDDNSNAANSNDANANDDNGNSANSNDDNGGGGGGNTNDSNSNANDDNSGGGGGNNSGRGGNDDSGGGSDDHGGNSNDD